MSVCRLYSKVVDHSQSSQQSYLKFRMLFLWEWTHPKAKSFKGRVMTGALIKL